LQPQAYDKLSSRSARDDAGLSSCASGTLSAKGSSMEGSPGSPSPLPYTMIGRLLAIALWAAVGLSTPVPGSAQDTSSPDEQGGTPLLQGGVSTNSSSGDASSGQGSGGDIYNTTTGDPTNSPPPPVDPGADPNAPPVIPGNVTGNNNNQPGGGGYWAPPPHVPCGMNQLEAQAWGGGSPAGGFLSALGAIMDPYCRETFGPRPRTCSAAKSGALDDEGPIRLAAARFEAKDGRRPLIIPAAAPGTSQLRIAGRVMIENDANYRCFIKYLTVPARAWGDPAFQQDQIPQIKARLEDPMRRQIFDAMSSNPNGFSFKSIEGAIENINIRVEAITFMRNIAGIISQCHFTPAGPIIAAGKNTGWQASKLSPAQIAAGLSAPSNIVLNSMGVSAHDAIASFRNDSSSLDCLDAVELTILEAVDCVIGAARFNAEHPEGLQNIGLNDPNPPTADGGDDAPVIGDTHGVSIFKNVRAVMSNVQFSMMVPGDWAYMRNDPAYTSLPLAGGFQGENTIYMGKYAVVAGFPQDYLRPGQLNYTGFAQARYTGLGGETNKTAIQLAEALMFAFKEASGFLRNADPKKVGWTLLGRIKAGDYGPAQTGGMPPTVNPTCRGS
jgi:hypothetical protein